MQTISIDATNQIVGRLASRIAQTLRGKDRPDFRPDRLPEVEVHVTNVAKMKVTGRKLIQKKYHRFSGYPGGLKTTSLETMFAKHPDRVLITAVRGMLPSNRLRPRMLKRLIIKS